MWFECLAQQTLRPDGFVFVHSGTPMDATWQRILTEAHRHGFFTPTILHDPAPPHRREDNARFATLARLRNDLLTLARWQEPDLFLSLDTDIMLEDPHTVERLAALIRDDVCDIASPLTFLHPNGPRHWTPQDSVCWAYNFGFIPPGGATMQRPTPSEIDVWGKLVRHQIPMGCWLGNSKALACKYAWHENGEDVGFALALRDAGVECLADTSLYAWHCWSERHLPGGPEHVDRREQVAA
jgi:hypothetical protein